MAKETFFVVVTVLLAAAFVSCRADSRPVVEAEHKGLLFKVPVYENVIYTEDKWNLDVTHFKDIKEKLLDVTKAVVVDRKGYLSVAVRAWGFIGLFNKFLGATNELAKRGDISPKEKKSFGLEMSNLVQVVLATKAEKSNLSDKETYERVEIAMNGVEQVIQYSPVALYMDWNCLTINGQSMPQYFAPVIYWMDQNGYGMLLKIVSMVGGLFVNIGA